MQLRVAAYGATVFITAACALILEIVAGRLLAPYVGMSLYTWTAIIAVVLAGLSVGHWVGGFMAGPDVDAARGCRRVAAALVLSGASAASSLVLLRSLSGPVLRSGLDTISAITLLTGVVFFLPSLFVGVVSPILTKLAVDEAPGGHGRVIGRMYALGAVGSIAGTVLAGFLFISWVGSTGTVMAVAGAYLFLGLAYAVTRPPKLPTLMIWAVGGAALAGALLAKGYQYQAHKSPCTVESPYFCIRIVDAAPDTGRAGAVMVLDHLGHGVNDREEPRLLFSPYIHFVDELAKKRLFAPDRTRAFFIGGGPYTLPRAWLKDYREPKLTVAELDPAVTDAAVDHMWLTLESGLEIVHRDARAVLQNLPAKPSLDIVFGDAFKDISIPAHLVTREFHREIAQRLKPEGFYIINVVESRENPLFLWALVDTLAVDFAAVEVWLEEDQLQAGGRVTYVVVAGQSATPFAVLEASRGMGRRWLRHELTRPETSPTILTDDFAPVDRLMAHLILDPDLAEND